MQFSRYSPTEKNMEETMKVAAYVTHFLEQNSHLMWGYIGGFNADILEVFCENPENRFILNYHEQASAFAVNAYAALMEKPAVATASGAPSFCNLVAGIANAYFDSNPCVFLAGSPHSLAIRKDRTLRQNAFEEIDMVHLVSDITKYAVKINCAQDVPYELQKAFHIANTGRKGPVLVDIPYNIAREDIDLAGVKNYEPEPEDYDVIDARKVGDLLRRAKKPLILVGGGARSNSVREKLRVLLDKVHIPVVASLCGLDVLAHDHPCFRGFIGHYGNRYANLAVAHADCLIIMGSRLDERQMGGYRTRLRQGAGIIRVDVDRAELGRKFDETISIHSTVENFLDVLNNNKYERSAYDSWMALTNEWKSRYPSYDYDIKIHNANNFLHVISEYLSDDCVICADVGQNQMCVAQAIRLDHDRRLINSAGYGSMGFSLPAAIGAAYARPGTMIVSVNGDGGIQMNIQELHTLKRDNLPVNVIVLNNTCLGMIRKTQEKLFHGKTFVSVDGYSVPDFESVSKAYGIDYIKIERREDYGKLRTFFSSTSPRFIEVSLPLLMENYPEPGDVIDRQNPLLSEEEYGRISMECSQIV